VTAAMEYVGMGFEATVLESYVGSPRRTAALPNRGLRWLAAVPRGCARWAHAWLPVVTAPGLTGTAERDRGSRSASAGPPQAVPYLTGRENSPSRSAGCGLACGWRTPNWPNVNARRAADAPAAGIGSIRWASDL